MSRLLVKTKFIMVRQLQKDYSILFILGLVNKYSLHL